MFTRLPRTVCGSHVVPLVAALLAVALLAAARIAGGVACAAEPLGTPMVVAAETAEDAVVLPPAAALIAEQEAQRAAPPAAAAVRPSEDDAAQAGSPARPGKGAKPVNDTASEKKSGPKQDSASDDDAAKRCRGMIPVCRRVPRTVKKPHVEYSMKCELVCVPGCGCLGHGGHHGSCAHCAKQGGGCGDVRIRQKKLLLKEVTEKEHESYEYKIVWVCPACAGFGGRCAAVGCTDHPDAHAAPHARSEAGPQDDGRHRSTEPRFADRLLEWLPPLR